MGSRRRGGQQAGGEEEEDARRPAASSCKNTLCARTSPSSVSLAPVYAVVVAESSRVSYADMKRRVVSRRRKESKKEAGRREGVRKRDEDAAPASLVSSGSFGEPRPSESISDEVLDP